MTDCTTSADIDSPVPRYPRRGKFPVIMPTKPDGKPIRLAIVYAVCYPFRVPVFRRLTNHPALTVRIHVGQDFPGTKIVNAKDTSGLEVRIMWTWQRIVRSSGRLVPLAFSPTLFVHLIRHNPDVLLIQGAEALNNLLVFIYAGLFRKPVIWWSLGEVRGRKHYGLGLLYRRLVQWLERRADAYLGYSSVAIDYFLNRGYEPRRCFNLVNVVDTDLTQRKMETARELVEPLRDKLGVRGKRVLLYVGALSQTKRIDRLIHAYAQLGPTPDPVHLVIVGDGPERRPAEKLVKTLGIEDRVSFTGAVYDDVSAYFQLADLIVMPGTGGLVISEAMTHGKPVVCSVGDGCELDLVEEGLNGYVVSPDGVHPLVDAIRRCLGDPRKLLDMGRHARQIIDEKHNISRYMNEMLSCIAFTYNERYNRLRKRNVRPARLAERPGPKACSFCGHTGSTTVRDTDGGDYRKCLHCRSEVQIGGNRDARAKFEDEQKRYYHDQPALISPLLRAIDRNHACRRLAMLQRYLTSGRLLEVGPGTGDVLDLAKAAGYEVEGVEHSPVLARRIQEQHGVTVYGGAFEDLDVPHGRYDGWLSFHVVEHVPDPIAHLARAAQVVRPGGYAFMATPSTGSWQHRVLGHWSSSYSTAHLHLFSERGLRAVLERVGWQIAEVRTVTPPESWLRFVTACIRRLCGRSGGAQSGGAAVRRVPSGLGTRMLRPFQVVTAPLRAIQDGLGGGHELLIVARRR